MDTNTANDKNGVPLAVGDQAIFRGTVKHLQNGSAMLGALNPGALGEREFWFHGAFIERVAQGAASIEADRKLAVAPPAAAPATPPQPAAVPEPATPRDQAIAYVMTHGRTREAAEKIVDEFGWRTLLADRDEEKADADRKASEKADEAPATSTTANQNEAAAPGAGDPKAS